MLYLKAFTFDYYYKFSLKLSERDEIKEDKLKGFSLTIDFIKCK
jgi:hypothetical protein